MTCERSHYPLTLVGLQRGVVRRRLAAAPGLGRRDAWRQIVRQHLSRAGLARAAQVSWERTANETQAVYDEIFENWRR